MNIARCLFFELRLIGVKLATHGLFLASLAGCMPREAELSHLRSDVYRGDIRLSMIKTEQLSPGDYFLFLSTRPNAETVAICKPQGLKGLEDCQQGFSEYYEAAYVVDKDGKKFFGIEKPVGFVNDMAFLIVARDTSKTIVDSRVVRFKKNEPAGEGPQNQ